MSDELDSKHFHNALGTFSAQEALPLKSALRRIIDCTSGIPSGVDEQQQSLEVGPVT